MQRRITLVERHEPAALLCHRQSGRTNYAAGLASAHGLLPATKQPHASLVFCLMVSTRRNPCNYMNSYSFTGPAGMEGWVGMVGWPISDGLPTKWSRVNDRSGKFRQLKTDVLTTEPRRQRIRCMDVSLSSGWCQWATLVIIIIRITTTIFIVLSSTAPAVCESSFWFLWAKVGQRQVAANL